LIGVEGETVQRALDYGNALVFALRATAFAASIGGAIGRKEKRLTVFAWPWRDGKLDVTASLARDEAGPILSLAYASGATITRLNTGLRRRKDKSIFGFAIDPATGRWTGSTSRPIFFSYAMNAGPRISATSQSAVMCAAARSILFRPASSHGEWDRAPAGARSCQP
jgi:hypothetical protein